MQFCYIALIDCVSDNNITQPGRLVAHYCCFIETASETLEGKKTEHWQFQMYRMQFRCGTCKAFNLDTMKNFSFKD